jgi:peptidoglycan/xylan/chitin deacetylase (PgdA/CDA1 family)
MRRLVCSLIALVALILPFAAQARRGMAAPSAKEIAFTIDDLPLNGREYGIERTQKMTAKLVGGIVSHRIAAVGFVNEAQLYVHGELDSRVALLEAWLAAGLELGNHTFSHPSFQVTPLAKFEEEVIRGETVTRMLAKRHQRPLRYFRHPFLHTGPDLQTRLAFETFLQERGYTIAPVTMDTNDWMFGLVYGDAKDRNDQAAMRRVADAYLAYVDAVVEYSEAYSKELFGRQIRQILLLHANDLTADHFDGMVRVFEKHGYTFVTLEHALQDEAYRGPDTYAGKDGTNWFDRWAFTRGAQVGLKDCEPVEWIREAYERLDAEPRPSIRAAPT